MKRLVWFAAAAAIASAAGCFGGVFADDYRTCSSDPDCHNGERCLMTATGAVCVTSQDSRCSSNASCPTGTACGADGACRTVCDASGSLPCLVGQACKDAVCVGADARHDPGAAGGGEAGSAGSGGAAGPGGAGGGSGASGAPGTGGGTAGAGGGTAGTSGAGGVAGSSGAGGTGGNANPCSSASDCKKCCDPSGNGIPAYANFVLNACGCGSQALCTSECSLNCEVTTTLQISCINCLNSISTSATCKAMALSQCDANASCKSYRACVKSAQCE